MMFSRERAANRPVRRSKAKPARKASLRRSVGVVAVLASLASILSLALVSFVTPAPAGASVSVTTGLASWSGGLSCTSWSSVAVPADATNVTFTLTGGGGAAGDTSSGRTGGSGGKGSVVSGTLSSVAGTTLQAKIGCGGTDSASAKADGWATGGTALSFSAGGGGAASALCVGSGANCSGGTMVAIAGGGGGGGQGPTNTNFLGTDGKGGVGGDGGGGTTGTGVNTGQTALGGTGGNGTGGGNGSVGVGGVGGANDVPTSATDAPLSTWATGNGADSITGGNIRGGAGGGGLRGGARGTNSTSNSDNTKGGGGGGAGQSWAKTTGTGVPLVTGISIASVSTTGASCTPTLIGTQPGFGAAPGGPGCAGYVTVSWTSSSRNPSTPVTAAACTGWSSFQVPATAKSATVVATGGGGGGGEGGGGGSPGVGGGGSTVTGTFSVTPGATIYARAGCGGGGSGQHVSTPAGGSGYTTGGAGNGGGGNTNQSGGGGGSAAVCTGVSNCGSGATMLVVAGGGGGGGARRQCTSISGDGNGGAGGTAGINGPEVLGGGASIRAGFDGGSTGESGKGGGGGTATGAGAAGAGSNAGTAGSGGNGGQGGTNSGHVQDVGGGGGGAGYFGGGGGGGDYYTCLEASGGGGGAGSSYLNTTQLAAPGTYQFGSASGTAANCGNVNAQCVTGGTGQGGNTSSSGASGAVSITWNLGPSVLVVSGSANGTASATANVGPFTAALQDANGASITSDTAVTLTLGSSSPGTKGFAATSGGTFGTTITIPAGATSATFYYGDSKAGTPTLTASASGLSVTNTMSATINPGSPSKVGFLVQPGGAQSQALLSPQPQAEIQDSFGNRATNSVANITLTIASSPAQSPAATLTGCTGTTSAGLKVFSGCSITGAAGNYTLTATAGVLTTATSGNITITAFPGIRGRVVKDSAPSQGAPNITVRLWSSPAGFSPTYFTSTDANGYYTLPANVPAGTWKVIFTDPSETYVTEWYDNSLLRSTSTDVVRATATEETNVNASLATGSTIAGTITPNVPITARLYNVNPVGASPIRQVNFPTGTFSFKALPVGTYYLAITDQAGSYEERWYNGQTLRESATAITIGAPGATSNLTAQSFLPAPTVSGTVKNAGNVGLENLTVSAYDASTGVLIKSVKTGPTGAYELTNLTGPVKVYVKDNAKQYAAQWVGGTSLATATPQAVPSTVNVTVQAVGTVSGTVTDEVSGDPIEGARVWLYLDGVGVASVLTDGSGTYFFLGLAPGTTYTTQYIATGFKTEYNADKSTKATADLFAVTSGNDTVADAALAPT